MELLVAPGGALSIIIIIPIAIISMDGWMITFGPMVRGLYITVIVTMIT